MGECVKLTSLGYGRAMTVCSVRTCEHAVIRHGDVFAHCEYAKPRLELNSEFRNGPETNCRAKLWGGVKELPVPTIAEQQREAVLAKQAESAIALLKAFDAVIPAKDEDIRAGLDALVLPKHLPRDVAARVETQLIAEKEAGRAF